MKFVKAEIMFKKKKKTKEFDKENLTPMIRTSICTGEQVAGFKDKRSGKFEEIALIKNDADLSAFKAQYGIEGEIPKFY